MEPGRLGVVADLDVRIGQLSKLLNGFHVGSAHVRGGDDAELAAAVRKLSQLVHDESQTAPFDEGHQHVNSVSRDDLLFELCEHLRLMHRAGEKRALCDGGFRTDDLGPFVQCQHIVFLIKKCKKLLRTLCNGKRVEVSFFCFSHNGGHNAVDKLDLRSEIAAIVFHVV